MRNNKIYAGLIVIMLIFLTGCKKGDNIIDTKPAKDPRTYTWTADTLGYPESSQTLMYDIWGSSPKDVYAVGHNSRNRGFMWHYDGKVWTDVHLTTSEGGLISGAINLTAIYGFSSTVIYAAGSSIGYNPNPPPNFIDSSLIIHYDGSAWRQEDTFNGSFLNAVYGISSTEIWAGGYENTLFYYDSNKWQRDSIKNFSVSLGFSFSVSSISLYNSTFYLIVNSYNSKTGEITNYFFKKINNDWVLQDSSVNLNYKFGLKLNRSGLPGLYSYGGGGIFKYNGTTWNSFYQTSYPISSMWGTKENNIFATTNVKAYHYNGADWKEIEQLTSSQADYWAVWTDGTEAFVVGHINDGVAQKTIVWHGK